ncbi:early protein E6 [Human papillomavirus type 210]|nr:early protein E6 [Human papillomavirus type 210]
METYRPTNIPDFCSFYNLKFTDVGMRCCFCKSWLNCVELASFHFKCLSLLWRENNCFACCCQCLRLSAKYEFQRYYRCSVKARLIEDIVQTPLNEIVIRCYHCFCLLDFIEKLEHKYRDDLFHLVRSFWRGECRHCCKK